MTERRFTDKPALDPSSVWGLAPDHPAMRESRTLFPSTVATVDETFEDRLLVSGRNSRKLGETIIKGKFTDYKLYSLALEERATCPVACDARAFCYGNGMQFARRHRIRKLDYFALILEDEIREILLEPSVAGLMVRLHVLGDFPSTEYVAMWADLLDEHQRLACYGYTHWSAPNPIAAAVASVKERFGDRFRIRQSGLISGPDRAVVIDHIPAKPRIAEGLVCPAQTDAAACCASCGLCWGAPNECIVFIKHGRTSIASSAEISLAATAVANDGMRPVCALDLPSRPAPAIIDGSTPKMRLVAPTDLRVEPIYQRDLSARSIKLIRKIVASWDWVKFKPPICAEAPTGLFVIDGQHTAIAAASHPAIKSIPVMIVDAPALQKRASAFVAHNRDRLAMSKFQLLYAEASAAIGDAHEILRIVTSAGARVPRVPPRRGKEKVGDFLDIQDAGHILSMDGAPLLERIVRIAVAASVAPIGTVHVRALRLILNDPYFSAAASYGDSCLADGLHSIKNLNAVARSSALETGDSVPRAAAILIVEAASKFAEKEA